MEFDVVSPFPHIKGPCENFEGVDLRSEVNWMTQFMLSSEVREAEFPAGPEEVPTWCIQAERNRKQNGLVEKVFTGHGPTGFQGVRGWNVCALDNIRDGCVGIVPDVGQPLGESFHARTDWAWAVSSG